MFDEIIEDIHERRLRLDAIISELRRQGEVWFSLCVAASIMMGILLAFGSISVLLGYSSASIVTIIASTLPGGFGYPYFRQYQGVNRQIIELSRKSTGDYDREWEWLESHHETKPQERRKNERINNQDTSGDDLVSEKK